MLTDVPAGVRRGDHWVLRVVSAGVRPLLAAFALAWMVNLLAILWNPWDVPHFGPDATIAYEGGPWTWLSVLNLLGVAAMTYVVTRGLPDRRWWLATTGLFVYFAADEGLRIHERFDDLAGTSDVLHYGWAIPGVFLVGSVALLFSRWVLRMGEPLRTQLISAGGMFLAGALVIEVLAGLWQTASGDDRVFFLITTVEETFEVVAVLVAARAIRLDAALSTAARHPHPSAEV